MKEIGVQTKRGVILNGVLFDTEGADTVVINLTGIHGYFYSNPFYYNFGDTFNANGIDFIYAQANDAFTKEVAKAFFEILNIPPENIYIKYDDIKAWGVNGMYIDRRIY